jgi:hypothetical protein
MVLGGRAAKLKRRSQLVARGVEDEGMLDEMTTSVGLAGVPFVVNVDFSGDTSLPSLPLPSLPAEYVVHQVTGERWACDALLAYHKHTCDDSSDTNAGRDYALARGWAAPQQALALAGHHPGSSTHRCTVLISIHHRDAPVAVLAMSLTANARSCTVQAIHVSPQQRGLQLPAHMWDTAKECVALIARRAARPVRLVKFTLAMACCQSQQGAHFWIQRMKWDGTEEAKEAALAWNTGKKWKPGTYELWYDMPV